MSIERFEEKTQQETITQSQPKPNIKIKEKKDKRITHKKTKPKTNFVLKIHSVIVLSLFSSIFRLFLKIFTKKEERFKKEAKPIIRFKSIKSFFIIWLLLELLVVPAVLYVGQIGIYVFNWVLNTLKQIFNNTSINFDFSIFSWKHLFDFTFIVREPIIFFILFIIFNIYTFKKSRYYFERFRDYNNNEHGDDKLLEPKQMKKTYKKIPNRAETFKGYGGIPVSHEVKGVPTLDGWLSGNALETKMNFHFPRKGDVTSFSTKMLYLFGNSLNKSEKRLGLTSNPSGYYYIEDGTVNTIVTGMTRSGKGETLVNPTIDNLSRAEKKSSMNIGDPKGELYRMWAKTLEKRGYNVMALNFLDMESSMSYNPLYLAIEYAKKGYFEETQIQINRIAEAIYRTGSKDGATKYFEDSSIALFNAIALALMWRADESYKVGELDSWDTVTLRNLVEFLTKLGSESVVVDKKGNTKSKLTIYFDGLKQINRDKPSKFLSMADNNFRSSDFSGDEQKGNIYSSMLAGISLYMNDSIAKLTSKNSIDLRSIGFPRRILLKITKNEEYFYDILKNQVAFLTIKDTKSQKTILKRMSCKIDVAGYMTLLVDPFLPDNFTIEVDFNHSNNTIAGLNEEKLTILVEKVRQDGEEKYVAIESEQSAGVNLNLKDIDIIYSEKPSAVFLILPPSRKEYGMMASFFIDQTFNVNFELAGEDGKCQNRIVNILDEFGNLPKIQEMSTKLSIGLSAGLLFILFVQNLEQITKIYDDKDAQSIISNCSINILIKTTSKQTAEVYSELSGTKTIYNRQKTSNPIDNIDSSHSHLNVANSTMAQPVMTKNQLLKLQSGEAFIAVGVKANTIAGNKTTNHPILVKDKYQYPYRYMFLFDECSSDTKFSDIKVNSEHINLDLRDIELDYSYEFETILELSGMSSTSRIREIKKRKGYKQNSRDQKYDDDAIQKEVENISEKESDSGETDNIAVGVQGFGR